MAAWHQPTGARHVVDPRCAGWVAARRRGCQGVASGSLDVAPPPSGNRLMCGMKALVVLVAFTACNQLPFKKNKSSGAASAPAAPSENEAHWAAGATVATLPGFRSYVTSQPGAELRQVP